MKIIVKNYKLQILIIYKQIGRIINVVYNWIPDELASFAGCSSSKFLESIKSFESFEFLSLSIIVAPGSNLNDSVDIVFLKLLNNDY